MSEQKSKRLIEAIFPYEKVSKVGCNERYFHGRTSHSLHVWWARRPFSAMRAVVFSSLISSNLPPKLTAEYTKLTEDLAASIDPSPFSVKMAQDALIKIYGRPPKVLDIFGGGGTIALEGARLGCIPVTIDINPLACFIQHTILRYSQVPNLPGMVKQCGKQLLQDLKKETKGLYRQDETNHENLVFFWGHATQCKNCGNRISLSRLGWLSKSRVRKVFFRQYPELATKSYSSELLLDPSEEVSENHPWETSKGISCPFCWHVCSKDELQELTASTLEDNLLCVCIKDKGRKSYILPTTLNDFSPSADEIQKEIKTELQRIGNPLPRTELPRWSGIINPALYGINSHATMFNGRQLVVLLKVIRYLRELYVSLTASSHSEELSLATVAVLSGFIDQLVDWNSRLSMWIANNEQVGRALAGPGMPMLWDYVEIDPFSSGPANLYDKLSRITRSLAKIPRFPFPAKVYKASATSLPFTDKFDAIITDPPYADNLVYSALADCVYVWKRMVFKDILPEIFEAEQTACEDDIVASPDHYEPFSTRAMKFYEDNLMISLKEAARVLHPEGILALFFTHSTIDAWATLIRALRKARYTVTAAWPLILERQARPRGMSSHAVNVSTVLVARKKSKNSACNWAQLGGQIKEKICEQEHSLKFAGWNEVEIGIACFVKAIETIAQYDEIQENDMALTVEECLKRIVSQIKNIAPAFSLQTRLG